MTDFTTLTLGYLLSHANTTIRRAAGSILKTLQRAVTVSCDECKKEITQYEYNKNKGFCNACNDVYKL